MASGDSDIDAQPEQRIVPVLSRLIVKGMPGPFSVRGDLTVEGIFRLARTERGRLMFDMWADVRSSRGRTYGAVDGEGSPALAGQVFAEHVLTRPFAPPGARRVERLEFRGAPEVRDVRGDPVAADTIISIPPGATPIESQMTPEPTPRTFGLLHTDSNHHVNSLTYLRVVEEAALRRFASLGRPANVLGRFIDIAYRKPCFAGQNVRIVLRAYELPGTLGVVAMVVDDAEEQIALGANGVPRPHVCARMEFEP
jgi:acyl-CoA thioesterase FadM